LVSLELLKGETKKKLEGSDSNVALVPLGTPLLAGPGAIVAIMLFVQEANTDGDTAPKALALTVAVLLVHILIGLTLMFSTKIVSVIKESGVDLLARIAGLLLAAIAVEMLISAIKEFFPTL
jgi:multiple antibiotic resistance protein